MNWESIESAPKDASSVLLWDPNWECPVVGQWIDDSWQAVEWLIADATGEIEFPVYWLFYPDPPVR